MKRLLARVFYRKVAVCFACCREVPEPCPGHEYGGMIIQARARRLTPWWVGRWVDCRWSW